MWCPKCGVHHIDVEVEGNEEDQPAAEVHDAMKNEDPHNDLLFVSFNQEASCISVGTRQGFAIFNCEPFGKCFEEKLGGIGIAEMLYCTSLVVLVGAGDQAAFSPRRMRVWNTKTNSAICDLNFVTAVLAVRMNRQRLLAILERKIYIFDINSMKILETLDTAPNPKAICAFSPDENAHLAFPSGAGPGEIVLYDANNLSVLNAFEAHRSAPVAMAFNAQGDLLATASETGTLIRVFGVPGGKRVASFRRGSYAARIYCLAFNETSSVLCASSDSGTVHLFSLSGDATSATGSFGHFTPIASPFSVLSSSIDSTNSSFTSTATMTPPASHPSFSASKGASVPRRNRVGSQDAQPNGRGTRQGSHVNSNSLSNSGSANAANSNLDDVAGAVGALLPRSLTGLAEGTRDFAYARLRSSGVPNVVALRGPRADSSVLHLLVATADGFFYEYSVDVAVGGECKLERENVLRESGSEEIEATYLT